jgi:hypothetical protein
VITDPAGNPDRLVTATNRGEVTVLRYADGEPVHRRRLPWTPSRPESGHDTYPMAVGERLLLIRSDPNQSSVTAYDIDTLDQLWTLAGVPFPWIQDCGVVICMIGHEHLSGMDPDTGRPRWQIPGLTGIAWAGGGRVLANDGNDPPVQRLIDTTDGRQIGPGGVGQAYPQAGDADSVVLLRTAVDPPGFSGLSRLDLRTGRTRLIGAVRTDREYGCDSLGRHLLCRSPDRVIVTTTG